MIKKYILFFLISLIFNQDFLPINNQTLNFTQIFFKWPLINNAESYQLYFDNQTGQITSVTTGYAWERVINLNKLDN